MSELSKSFNSLGYDLLSFEDMVYFTGVCTVDTGTPTSCPNSGGSCDDGCMNGCKSCKPKCSAGGMGGGL